LKPRKNLFFVFQQKIDCFLQNYKQPDSSDSNGGYIIDSEDSNSISYKREVL